jgi:FolB domain-containing protein
MIARIRIDGLAVDCVIGCLPQERAAPQRISLDLWLDVDIQRTADSDAIQHALDYTDIARQAGFILTQGRFHLLESASRALLRHLLLPPHCDETRPAILAAGVTLTKHGVFSHGAVPRITLSDTAAAQTFPRTEHPWGSIEAIDTSRRILLQRLCINAGHPIPDGPGAQLVLSGAPGCGRGGCLLRLTRPDWSRRGPGGADDCPDPAGGR